MLLLIFNETATVNRTKQDINHMNYINLILITRRSKIFQCVVPNQAITLKFKSMLNETSLLKEFTVAKIEEHSIHTTKTLTLRCLIKWRVRLNKRGWGLRRGWGVGKILILINGGLITGGWEIVPLNTKK